MLKSGRMELWGNFDQAGDTMSFASSENFVIAFMGSGQVAYFDDNDSGFANIDPVYCNVKIIDYPAVLENSMSYRISRGILTGLQDVLGIYELSDCAEALAAALGITLAEFTPGTPQIVATSVASLMEIISIIQSVYTVADSAGGIYSTAMGEGNKYDKAEAFAHDATMLAVSLIFLWGTVSLIKNCTSLFRSASQNLIGRTSHLTPSEVTQTYKEAKLLASFEEFTEYTKGFLDEDALKYAKEVLGDDADDIARLKKIAQLIEDGSKKIGKKLSKEELKAGLDALWDDGGVEGALAAMEFYHKWGQKIARLKELRNSLPEKYQKITVRGYKLGNVAYSSSEIEGYSVKEIKAFSQYGNQVENGIKNPVAGWVSSINDPAYSEQVLKVNANGVIDSVKGYLRNNDTEYKIIEYYNQMLKGKYDIKGKISIVSERDICPSCDNVIKAFSREYSNIVIDVVSGTGKVYTVKNGLVY